MNKWVFINPYIPQTLQAVVYLTYFNIAFTVLFFGLKVLFNPIVLGYYILMFLGAFGIANVRWWGYIIASVFALWPFAMYFYNLAISDDKASYLFSIIGFPNTITVVIQIAIVALLFHPMSRDYVKRNFEKTVP